jgi:uncharacterized protein YdeI (YjbR/CyaY-like superfamily)
MDEQKELLIAFETPDEWREWLKKNHEQQDVVWVHFFKKDSGVKSINYAEALDEALCFGWIDGQVKKVDVKSWKQRFTPRRARSNWSVKNTQNIERLTKLGKREPAGMKQVEAARADGRWQQAYESQKKGRPPDDFILALSKNIRANEFFKTLDKHNLYAIYYRIQSAKKPETRENRIKMIIAMLEKGLKLH